MIYFINQQTVHPLNILLQVQLQNGVINKFDGKKKLVKYKRKDILLIQQQQMEQVESQKYLAIIISQVKSSSRELYPLTKNYPMALLSIGSKKLIVYQLQALLNVGSLEKIIIINSQENKLLQHFIQTQFLPLHRDYPHRIDFRVAKDLSNTTLAVKEALQTEKVLYKGYIVQHADTINAVPLKDIISFHQSKKSQATLVAKPKKELGQQEKKLPQGELETEIDNVLVGQNSECLFMDMMDELDNQGVKIDPSIFKQIRRANFRRIVDSRTYVFNYRIISILLGLNHQEIYEIKPYFIQLLVKNQTNTRLLSLAGETSTKPLRIYIHLSDQNTYIKKVSSKKIYQTMNFDSIIRGPKQKEVLMPSLFSDKLDERKQFKGNASVVESALIGANTKVRRSCVGFGCKIGKNVQILNSIILDNVEIKDNCKIMESTLGSGCTLGEGVTIKNSYAEGGCRVADGATIQSEVLIRSE